MRRSWILALICAVSLAWGTNVLSQEPDLARDLLEQAQTALKAGNTEAAEQAFSQALQHATDIPGSNAVQVAEISRGLAGLIKVRGRTEEALRLYLDSLRRMEAEFGPDDPQTIAILGLYGVALGELGYEKESAGIAQRVYDALTASLGPNHPDTLMALLNLAAARYYTSDLEAAEAMQRDFIEGWTKISGATDVMAIEARRGLAVMLEEADKLDLAAIEYVTAMSLANNHLTEAHSVTLHIAASAASFLSRLERPDLSLEILEAHIGDIALTFGLDAAITRTAMGDLVAARLIDGERPLETLSTINFLVMTQLDELHRRPEGAQTERLGATYQIAEAAWLADVATMVAIRSFGPAPHILDVGFRAAQAPSLGLTALATSRASAIDMANRTGAGALVLAWEDALENLANIDAQLNQRAAASPQLQDVDATLGLSVLVAYRQQAQTLLENIEAQIAQSTPDFFELVSPRPVTIQDLQGENGLGPDDVVILLAPSSFPGDEDGPGRVWAVTRNDVAWADIPMGRQELSEAVGRLHALLARPGSLPSTTVANRAPLDPFDPSPLAASSLRAYDGQLAFQLYSALFEAPNIAAILEDKPNWIVAPQGSLLSLPFAALLSEPPRGALNDAASLREASWLGLGRNISVIPSLTNYRQLASTPAQSKTKQERIAYIGIGDPLFSVGSLPDDPRFSTRARAVDNLPRLPGTRLEITALAGYFGASSKVLLGTQATKAGIRALDADGSLARADILHFATHGILAGGLPELGEPALALTPSNSGGIEDDGLLTSSEIAGMTLRAGWVILSACDTAAGATPDAEGLSGMARAFFHAGARSMLVSHWAVQDDVAARLIEQTVVHTSNDALSKPAALRQAMRTMVEDTSRDTTSLPFSHPALWAPFQFVGTD